MQQKNELPEGWILSQLINTVLKKKGKKPSLLAEQEWNESVPYLDIKAFESGNIRQYADINSSVLINKGDILVVWDGARCGLVGKAPVDGAIGSTLMHLSQNSLNPDYLYYFLQSNYEYINLNPRGTGIPHVDPDIFWDLEIPISPLSEQHRVVSAIEALLACLDATNEKLDRVPQILKKFRQSVLAAACDGRLTEEWRKENPSVKKPEDYLKEIKEIRNICSKKDELKFKTVDELDVSNLLELPDSWLWISSNLIFSYVTSGSRGWAKYYSDTGSMFLRIGNLDRNSIYLNLENIQRVTPPDSAEGRRTRIQKNDILISITADIGSVGYICEELGDAYINQHIALARPVQNLNPKYIAYFLHSQTGGKIQFEKLHRGATKIGLGLDDIRSLAIPLPPLSEQQEIVRCVDSLFAFADSIEAKVIAAREKTEKIRQSILSKAFSGDLVETEAEIARREGRDYETAEVLLEKIKREKAKTKGKTTLSTFLD